MSTLAQHRFPHLALIGIGARQTVACANVPHDAKMYEWIGWSWIARSMQPLTAVASSTFVQLRAGVARTEDAGARRRIDPLLLLVPRGGELLHEEEVGVVGRRQLRPGLAVDPWT